MSLRIHIPSNLEVINKQIQALDWQLKNDINDKDRAIHQEALKTLKERKEQLEVGD